MKTARALLVALSLFSTTALTGCDSLLPFGPWTVISLITSGQPVPGACETDFGVLCFSSGPADWRGPDTIPVREGETDRDPVVGDVAEDGERAGDDIDRRP